MPDGTMLPNASQKLRGKRVCRHCIGLDGLSRHRVEVLFDGAKERDTPFCRRIPDQMGLSHERSEHQRALREQEMAAK